MVAAGMAGPDTVKYKIALILGAILGAIVIGDGLVKSMRAERHSSQLTATVGVLSPQELAASVVECEAPLQPGKPRRHDAAYCAEVSRRLDNQPLQIVDTPARKP